MATPRKALEIQKGRKSAKKKAEASKRPEPMGKAVTSAPPEVAADKIAAVKWAEAVAAYKEAGYTLSAGDKEALTRLCLMYSEAEGIRRLIKPGMIDFLEMHRLLDSKRGKIYQLENCLFLNPVARMRGLPAKPAEKQVPDNLKGLEGRL